MARGNVAKADKKYFRHVVGRDVLFDNVLAVRMQCPHDKKCSGGCRTLVKEGQQAWFADGSYFENGEDRWYHDKCL